MAAVCPLREHLQSNLANDLSRRQRSSRRPSPQAMTRGPLFATDLHDKAADIPEQLDRYAASAA